VEGVPRDDRFARGHEVEQAFKGKPFGLGNLLELRGKGPFFGFFYLRHGLSGKKNSV
jgi:hypothetical protein